ncbi:uncharacterized protein LY79DRAFT_2806 [Colletotrichum navitas]|uniref:Uncharacterized protein n=1 Tax=Colletotrichum navitas TaxID=681940 RepID=A0AAD8QCE9_9PEZI|nr:uncharacterized protein LY79DRAFT_2806 [Colletotrichum navitas]KAK1599977.1 hypothetical protein LY79DRAFT_2806 [Colletotrichum navitas]
MRSCSFAVCRVGLGSVMCMCVPRKTGHMTVIFLHPFFVHSSANRRSRPIFPAFCSDRKDRYLHQRARGYGRPSPGQAGPGPVKQAKGGVKCKIGHSGRKKIEENNHEMRQGICSKCLRR